MKSINYLHRLFILCALVFSFTDGMTQTANWLLEFPNPLKNGQRYGAAWEMDIDKNGNAFIIGIYTDSTYINNRKLTSTAGRGGYVAKYNAAKQLQWIAELKSTRELSATNIASDGNGGCYIATMFEDSLKVQNNVFVSQGRNDLFIGRFSSSGNLIWSESGGANSGARFADWVSEITVDVFGNLFVAGSIRGQVATFGGTTLSGSNGTDAFLIGYKRNGSKIIAKRFFSPRNEAFSSIQIDPQNGDIILGLDFQDSLSIGGYTLKSIGRGRCSAVVVLDSKGNYRRAYRFGNASDTYIKRVRIDGSRIYTCGGFHKKLNAESNSYNVSTSPQYQYTWMSCHEKSNLSLKWLNHTKNFESSIWDMEQHDSTLYIVLDAHSYTTPVGTKINFRYGNSVTKTGRFGFTSLWHVSKKTGRILAFNDFKGYSQAFFIANDPQGRLYTGGWTGGDLLIDQYTLPISAGPSATYVVGIQAQNNLLQGKSYIDENHNNQCDTNERVLTDCILTNTKRSFYYSAIGSKQFEVALDSGDYALLNERKIRYHKLVKDTLSGTFNGYGLIRNEDFVFQPIKGIKDVKISMVNFGGVRATRKSFYELKFENEGTDTANGTVVLKPSKLAKRMTFSVTPSAQNVDSIVWNYQNLLPGESRKIKVTFDVDSSARRGHPLTSICSILPIANDTVKANNIDTSKSVVTASYDPNFKVLLSDTSVQLNHFVDTPVALEYFVQFQNTGNDTAFDIIVLDTLNFKCDFSQFKIESSSHKMEFNLKGNHILEFKFLNIKLPDSATNFEKSIGYIKFKLGAYFNRSMVTEGLKNRVSIYFDLNPPVHTNHAVLNIVNQSPQIERLSDSLCFDAPYAIRINSIGKYFDDNRFILEWSDSLGKTFNQPIAIGSVKDSMNTILGFTIKDSLLINTNRSIRIRSTSPKSSWSDSITYDIDICKWRAPNVFIDTTYSLEPSVLVGNTIAQKKDSLPSDTGKTWVEVNTIHKDAILLYPNPTHGTLYLDFGQVAQASIVTIERLYGGATQQKTLYNTRFAAFSLDGKKGVYLVKINVKGKQHYVYKVVKL